MSRQREDGAWSMDVFSPGQSWYFLPYQRNWGVASPNHERWCVFAKRLKKQRPEREVTVSAIGGRKGLMIPFPGHN